MSHVIGPAQTPETNARPSSGAPWGYRTSTLSPTASDRVVPSDLMTRAVPDSSQNRTVATNVVMEDSPCWVTWRACDSSTRVTVPSVRMPVAVSSRTAAASRAAFAARRSAASARSHATAFHMAARLAQARAIQGSQVAAVLVGATPASPPQEQAGSRNLCRLDGPRSRQVEQQDLRGLARRHRDRPLVGDREAVAVRERDSVHVDAAARDLEPAGAAGPELVARLRAGREARDPEVGV